ncbi:MAG: hypothetical protein JSS69_04095 [Acidobacteria bacterium]|nr:hypothetical protein [Acidobacteriota bacterium]MBS1865077.1 hypothetical protein [Acidobacteriota bacterium]
MSTKSAILKTLLAAFALSAVVFSGCGGGSSIGNVVTITVSPAGSVAAPLTVIVTQTVTLAANVTGSTNTNVTWACTYATTTFDSTGKPATGTATNCSSESGTIPASSTNTTVIFTAPQTVADPRKITGNNCTDATKSCILEVTITATAAADTKKTATSVIIVDSGISVTLLPTTATVPTSSSFQFNATLTNDLQSQGVTWLISQGTIDLTKGINFPQLTTCDPGCGHIDTATGLYTAPGTVPTTATVTLVATSKADPTRFAVGTITIAKAGDITFNGISPTVMPQGAATYDLYIFAPGVTSASQVILTPTQGSTKSYNFNNPQLKILFPIPTATAPSPSSTGVRIRLNASDLSASATYTVSVQDQNHPPTIGSGPFQFSVVPVRAAVVASQPDSYVQNSQSGQPSLLMNGGYFGSPTSPSAPFVQATFLGNTVSANPATSSSRQLSLNFPASNANSAQPGLYQLSAARTLAPLPAQNNPSVTNLSLFPNYQNVGFPNTPPAVSKGSDNTPLTQASAIDIDQQTGIAAVATTGLNRVDFFQIGGSGSAGTITAIGFTGLVNVPTSVSINSKLHQVSVVSFKDQSVSVFQMPTAVNGTVTSPLAPITTISLSGLVPPSADTATQKFQAPFAYSVGVDSDTNHAVVAYSSPSNPTTALVGFLLDLNTGGTDCVGALNPSTVTQSPCVSGQVSIATGLYPQVAMIPHTHTAVVSPGGLGGTTAINVLQTSKSVGISNVSLTSGLVTVITASNHGLNPINPGNVLIAGVSKGATSGNDIFNGAFPVQSVINSTTFTYALAQTTNDTGTGGNVLFGQPNISFGGLAQTTQGVAVNPITGVVAAADANATGQNGPQINMLASLDQNFSSISFRATSTGGCTFYTQSCAGGPELLGTTSVAFQPFANLLVSYNGPQNQLSISDPVSQQRYAWVPISPQPTAATPTFTSIVPKGTTGFSVDIALNGGLAVDWASNQAVVVNSSTGTVTLVALGPTGSAAAIKPVHVAEVLVPSAAPNDPFTLGGIPGANFPQGTLTSTTDLTGVKIFGSGFTGAGTTVRLDGTSIPNPVIKSDREIDITIPASFLAVPHHYALDVVSAGATSNASDFFVVKSVDLSGVCKDSSGNPINTAPASVAVADQLKLGSYSPIAVVSNSGCNNVSVIDIAPQLPTFTTTGAFDKFVDNTNFGHSRLISTGSSPSGVAVSPRFGLAVVANNGAGTASILDLTNPTATAPLIPDVTTGSGPIGVAINEGTGAALVANTTQNTVSEINLGLLPLPSGTTTLPVTSIGVDTAPIAIAIDPDRGTNNNGLAVVTALALTSSFPHGVLDAVDIGSTAPAKSTSAATGTVTLTPTGVVFDPSVSPTLFYAVSSSGNLVTAFNPDTGAASSTRVGINPTSLALNPQTGGIVTVNTTTNTISIVDTLSSPFKTRRSFGLPGPPPAGVTVNQLQTNQVAIDQFLNMAVIVDQAHNRVLLFPLPN